MTWNTPKPQEWKSEELSQGRIIDYKAFNFVDGEGVRNSLYVSGCMFHCEGCYNAATWSFKAGIPYTKELEEQIMRDLAQPYVQGLTLLGGEPFLNTGILIPLVKRIREELPEKDIWSWTGYTIDVKKSLNQGEVVIWDKLNDGQTNYEQVDRKDML